MIATLERQLMQWSQKIKNWRVYKDWIWKLMSLSDVTVIMWTTKLLLSQKNKSRGLYKKGVGSIGGKVYSNMFVFKETLYKFGLLHEQINLQKLCQVTLNKIVNNVWHSVHIFYNVIYRTQSYCWYPIVYYLLLSTFISKTWPTNNCTRSTFPTYTTSSRARERRKVEKSKSRFVTRMPRSSKRFNLKTDLSICWKYTFYSPIHKQAIFKLLCSLWQRLFQHILK